jgi:ATPase subunit of ABC transporter with duplicated ATPase domains
MLVLDEVTNHLDAEARAAFGKLLRTLAPGRVVLLVSHDDAIIDLCDEKIFCQIPENASYISVRRTGVRCNWLTKNKGETEK